MREEGEGRGGGGGESDHVVKATVQLKRRLCTLLHTGQDEIDFRIRGSIFT